MRKLIERGKELGYSKLFVREIYNYNLGSKKLFEGAGFKKYKQTLKGHSYYLDLNK